MLHLPTLADRVWFALHCLPRDESGDVPSYRAIELRWKLPEGIFHKTIALGSSNHRRETCREFARALSCDQTWLYDGIGDAPLPTGIVPPRPGLKWRRHGELPGWEEAVQAAKKWNRAPAVVFRAGARLPVYRPVDALTPDLVIGVSLYAYETSTYSEQIKYGNEETAEARKAHDADRASAKQEKARQVKPAAK